MKIRGRRHGISPAGVSPADAGSPARAARSFGECCAVWLLIGAFVVVGLNGVRHDAFKGQDFSGHVGSTNRLLARPGEWFTQDFTSRPLIYWIALDGMALTRDRAPFEFAAVVFVLLNAAALWLLHDCARRSMTSPALRVAVVSLVAFLPVTLTTSVVFAADAVVQPPFALLCWSLIRWAEASSSRAVGGYAALAGVALAIGNFAKFTFIGLPVVVLGIALLLWRWRRVTAQSVVWMLALGVIAPLLAGLSLHQRARHELAGEKPWHGFEWSGTGEMTWRSLLGLRVRDARIFAAPTYWEGRGENARSAESLLEPNGYSYPALLHLAVFTDVLDLGHGGCLYGRAPRPALQQQFARWSVRTGLLFSIAAVIAVAALWVRLARAMVRAVDAPATGTVVWSVLGLAWFLPIVLALPFVHHAYDWGYWLPRLVLPAIWSFAFGLFAMLDHWIGPNPRLGAFLAIATLGQAWLQVRSFWF